MAQSIEKYVRNCQVCKETKPLNQIVTPPAGNFVQAKRCWRIVATDIAGPYPMTKRGNRYLLVAYDVFSKFVIAKPVKNVTAKIITDFIRTNVVLRYACPEIILSDNGKQYRSVEFNEYAKKMGIKLWYTTSSFVPSFRLNTFVSAYEMLAYPYGFIRKFRRMSLMTLLSAI